MKLHFVVLVAWLVGGLLAGSSSALVRDDRFLAGYVSAVVERELGLRVSDVRVDEGEAVVVLDALEGTSSQRVQEVVARIEGIDRVVVRVAGDEAPEAAGRVDEEAEAAGERGLDVLPSREIFDPLLADPREPHFSAQYQWFVDDEELTHVGSANFGETFALLGGEQGDASWQLGLLGGVFSIFDLDTESSDLVNSDFWVGPTLSLRQGRWSGQVRLYHQSSHLGDEYLLRNRVDRVNLSYEGVELLLSGDLHPAIRVYGGGGVLVHSNPDLHPLSVQGGLELRSPVAFLDDVVRPIAALDLQAWEEDDWDTDISVVAGLELSNPESEGLRLMILGSYFHGTSPNGQFYERRVEYLSVGTHLFF